MKLTYRREIDGLRAIAVIPVILFHVGFGLFSGGYSGVDVFFVISGYLITSIIYSEFMENRFSIIKFYERRARRILPLLFCVIAVTIPLAWISLFETDMVDFFQSIIAVITFTSNFLFTLEADYFDAATELKPLLHTWSLAVEEQYYILFPLFIMFFFKVLKTQKGLLLSILILCIGSFILAEWASVYYPVYNFYLLPSRVWELGIGAMLAILLYHDQLSKIQTNKLIAEVLGILGLALILFGMFFIEEDSPFPSAYALFPVIGTGLIIAFSSKDNISGKVLSLKPLVIIGLISYSAYLWHHPLFAFVKHLGFYNDSFTTKSILTVLVLPISFLSWKFVENPFRNKEKYKTKTIFKFSLIGSAFFILIGVVGIYNQGFPNRYINESLNVRNYIPDNRKLQPASWVKLEEAAKKLNNGYWFEAENSKRNLLLIGNSHSKDMYNVLTSSKTALANFNLGRVDLEISEVANKRRDFLSSNNYKSSEIVMLASRYGQEDVEYIDEFVNTLLSDGKKVVIVKEIHNFNVSDGKTNADLIIQKFIREDNTLDNNKNIETVVNNINRTYYKDYITTRTDKKTASDNAIAKVKANYPEIIVLDRMEYVCNSADEDCYAINSNLEKYFYDYGHHTLEGASFFGQRVDSVNWLAPLLAN